MLSHLTLSIRTEHPPTPPSQGGENFGSSIEQLDTNEVSTGLSRSIEIARVTIRTLVQVLLEGIEDVLYTSVYLKLQVFAQHKGVVNLRIEVEEVRRVYQLVLRDVAVRKIGWYFIGWRKVRYMHPTSINARQREIEILERSCREGKISIVVRRTGHVLGTANGFILAFCHKGGIICISEVIDISPGNLVSSLCFIQSSISHDVLCIGEGNGNPLQCSCLENPMDRSLVGCCLWGRTELDTTEAT